MKIIFWGTPSYALPSLNLIINSGHEVIAVVTQPDRKRNRGNNLLPSPVKQRALELGLKVFTPINIKNDKKIQNEIKSLSADIYIVVAFGQILPIDLLQIPPLGCWNAHGSMLPRWRGAGPIQWCLLSGDSDTGVGIMSMEEGLDTGPVLIQKEIKVGLTENATQLSKRLSELSAELLIKSIKLINDAGTGEEQERHARLAVKQQNSISKEITYARLIKKNDYLIDWELSSIDIHRKVMGLHPNAYTYYLGKRIKILSTIPLIEEFYDHLNEAQKVIRNEVNINNKQGTIIAADNLRGLIIGTGDYPILILEAKIEGKSKSNGIQLIQQIKASIGEKLC